MVTGYEVTKATVGYIRLLISKNTCTYTIMVTGYKVTKVTVGYCRLLIVKNACIYTLYMHGYWLRDYKGYSRLHTCLCLKLHVRKVKFL